MILIKFLAPVCLLVIAVLQHYLDYKWHDKRTTKHRIARILLFIFLIVSGVFTIFSVINEHFNSVGLKKSIDQLTEQAREESKAANAFREQVSLLNSKLKPFLEEAQIRFPKDPPEQALQKLADQVAELKNNIRDFQARVEMTFSGEWSDGLSKGEEVPVVLPDDAYISFIHSGNDRSKDVHCVPTAIKRFRDSDGSVTVTVSANVQPGQWPLGKSIFELTDYNRGEFAAAMIDRTKAKDAVIHLEKITYFVYVNGVQKLSFFDAPHALVTLPEQGIRIINMDKADILAELRN